MSKAVAINQVLDILRHLPMDAAGRREADHLIEDAMVEYIQLIATLIEVTRSYRQSLRGGQTAPTVLVKAERLLADHTSRT